MSLAIAQKRALDPLSSHERETRPAQLSNILWLELTVHPPALCFRNDRKRNLARDRNHMG